MLSAKAMRVCPLLIWSVRRDTVRPDTREKLSPLLPPVTNPTEELKDIIKNGLVSDILKMERAYCLHKAIGTNADILNARENGNFGELFGAFQGAMESEAVLAVARVYDMPSKRHPTRCIRRALDLMEQNSESLPEIVEAYNTRLHLEASGANREVIQSVSAGKTVFINLYVPYVRGILDSDETLANVKKLKDLRDKRIAHNDAATIVGPTWEALNDLIKQAQHFVGLVGWAFFSTVYVNDDTYLLSSDAQRPARALHRLATLLSQGHGQ
jgi:hypothetical protein